MFNSQPDEFCLAVPLKLFPDWLRVAVQSLGFHRDTSHVPATLEPPSEPPPPARASAPITTAAPTPIPTFVPVLILDTGRAPHYRKALERTAKHLVKLPLLT